MKAKKAFVVFLIACMFLSVFAVMPVKFKAYSYAYPLPPLTGNQLEDFLNIALSQVGYKEEGENETVYGAYFGHPDSPWCAWFISWCARQAGIDTSVIPSTGLSAGFYGYGKTHHASSGYIPRRGDIVVYGDSGHTYHAGIVISYDARKKAAYTIESNYSDQIIISQTDRFKLSSGATVAPYAYITPDYKSASPAGAAS